MAALSAQGIDSPFPIQVDTLPDTLSGRDVLGRGKTGSGKTLAFAIPMIARLGGSLAGGQRRPGRPLALILAPTRELATQITVALTPLADVYGLKSVTIFGGVSQQRQVAALKAGVDIVVACPGRLEDLMKQGFVQLDAVEISILDEADHMADLGFMPAVTALLDLTPKDGQRLLFSATLDRGVDKLVRSYLKDPAMHAVAAAASPVDTMDHLVFAVSHDGKVDVAAEIATRPGRTLFFVRTKHGADRLATQLRKVGVEAAAIHGNLTQHARKKALDNFTTGHARVLVATDVAARGIHVDAVDLVVHFDPPADHKDYLHRSGRTARAGARGTVLSLLLSDQVREHQRMRERAGVEASAMSVVPGHEAVRALATSGEPIELKPRPAYVDRLPSNRTRSGPPRAGGRPRPPASVGASGRPTYATSAQTRSS